MNLHTVLIQVVLCISQGLCVTHSCRSATSVLFYTYPWKGITHVSKGDCSGQFSNVEINNAFQLILTQIYKLMFAFYLPGLGRSSLKRKK